MERYYFFRGEPKVLIGLLIGFSVIYIARSGYLFGQYLHQVLN